MMYFIINIMEINNFELIPLLNNIYNGLYNETSIEKKIMTTI